MKKATTLLGFIAVFVLSASAFAQGGGQGRGQGRGMMMGGGTQSRSMLLGRTDVQADLKLTDKQKSDLQAAQEAAAEEMRNRMEEMRNNGGGGGFDREAMRAEMEAFQKKQDEKIKAIVTTEQWNRLGEIQIQLAGPRAALIPEVQKSLDLSGSQKNSLDALMEKQRQANQELMQRMRDGEIEREQLGELRAQNDKILGEEIAKILTGEQNELLKKMGGAPFKAEPNQGRGGGN
ncbi:MAG: Spy/CpxP family protein refolding chaperone [Fimbriimonadaceae bacterium]